MYERQEPADVFAAFGAPVFGLAGPEISAPRFGGSGWSAGEDGEGHITGVHLRYRHGGKDDVLVDTSVRELPTWHYVHHALFRATPGTTRVRFPLTLTVTREDRQIPVDDDHRTFSVYACRRAVIAVGVVDGRHVTIECRAALLRQLTLTRVDERTIAAMVEHDQREWESWKT